MKGRPKKLRSGAWGALVESEDVATGDVLTIVTRAGRAFTKRVVRVLWRGDGRAICATASVAAVPRRRGIAGADTCGYPCPVTGRRCVPGDPCHDCE